MAVSRVHLAKAVAATGFVAVLFASGKGHAQYNWTVPNNMGGYTLNTSGGANPFDDPDQRD
jgi:hypothetical protein